MIDRIFAIKKKYPGKINMLDSTLNLMKSKIQKRDGQLFI